MTDHRFIVTVSGCDADQAEQVMNERILPDEDYGFEYTIDWRSEVSQPGTPYVVGAPDVTPDFGPHCGAQQGGIVCTRTPDGHRWHAAGDGKQIVAVWGEPDAS